MAVAKKVTDMLMAEISCFVSALSVLEGSNNGSVQPSHTTILGNDAVALDVGPDFSNNSSLGSTEHQLQTVMLATLAQLCLSRVRHDQKSDIPTTEKDAWLSSYFQLPQIVLMLHNLPSLARYFSFSTLLSIPTAEQQIINRLERYAMTYFNGRLMPGCCYLGCTNLCGVNEKALPTMLCGGCREERYCSVKCQKSAWVHSGHFTVCGAKSKG